MNTPKPYSEKAALPNDLADATLYREKGSMMASVIIRMKPRQWLMASRVMDCADRPYRSIYRSTGERVFNQQDQCWVSSASSARSP